MKLGQVGTDGQQADEWGHNLISNKKKLKLADLGKDLIATALNKMINPEVLRKALWRKTEAAISG